MGVMRAQVSLQFDDADLFDNFIIPCKEDRRLNGIIVKCLKAYYNDAKVRDLVEGVTIAEASESEGVKSTQDICDGIRASLVMQDWLVEELKQTVDGGVDDVENILSQANKHAEDKGFGSAYTTRSGSTMLQLEAPKQQTNDEAGSHGATATDCADNGLASVLCQAVMMLAKDLHNSRVTELLQQVVGDTGAVVPPVMTETSRQTATTQVGFPTQTKSANFVERPTVVEPEVKNDFETSGESGAEDALSAMQDLFSSL